MDLKAQLTLSIADKVIANPRRIALLRQIQAAGSISQGAKLAGFSYKAAWDAVKEMNSRLDHAVVISEKGGKGGGGARLTEFGERLMQVYALTDEMQDMVLRALWDQEVPMQSLLDVMAHFSLKTSARNQISAKIVAIYPQGLNERIMVETVAGNEILVMVTQVSRRKLGLELHKSVLLLIKAPLVTLLREKQQDSDQNQFSGTVTEIKATGDSVEVTLDIGGGDILYASISRLLADELELAMGKAYYGVFKPVQAIIASMG